MNPRYPMGRWDYFKTSVLVSLVFHIPGALLVLLIENTLLYWYFHVEGLVIQEQTFPILWAFLYILGAFILLPLHFRRARAASIPFGWIWFALGLEVCDTIITEDFSLITVVVLFIYLCILLAPNRMTIIGSNPDSRNK